MTFPLSQINVGGWSLNPVGQTLVTFDPQWRGLSSLAMHGEGDDRTWYNFAAYDLYLVPEPSTWAMMLVGFGALGLQLRRKRQTFSEWSRSVAYGSEVSPPLPPAL